MNKLKNPSRTIDDPTIDWDQEHFGGGEYQDSTVPDTEVPDNAVKEALNMLHYPDWEECRPGTELFSTIPQPSLSGRDNYQGTKTGYIITRTAGDAFTQADVDNYWVWPETLHRDLIVEVIDGDNIRVKHNDTEVPATAANPARIVGPENAKKLPHYKTGLVFAFFDTRVFYTNMEMTQQWEEIELVSRRDTGYAPVNSYSKFRTYKNFIYLMNANGPFVIDTTTAPYHMWKINAGVPDNTITEQAETALRPYVRRYIYTMLRLTGNGNRNRGTAGCRIQQESGPCALDPNADDRDYHAVAHESENGTANVGTYSYRRLLCGINAPPPNPVANWAALGNTGVLTVNLNFTTGTVRPAFAGCADFDDVASAIQAAIRAHSIFSVSAPNATCEYDAVNQRFIFTAGTEEDNIAAYLSPTVTAVGETDISTINWLRGLEGYGYNATVDTVTITLTGTRDRGPLTPFANSRHLNFYGVYGTGEVGTEYGDITQKEAYAWLDDVPVMAVFDTYRNNADGHIHIAVGGFGAFRVLDEGADVIWADGTADNLGAFVSGTEMEGNGVLVSVLTQAMAIGANSVANAQQVGNVITRTGGTLFTAAAVGKTFVWADGGESLIVEYVNANNLRAQVAATRPNQGICWDPIARNWGDGILDAVVKDRLSTFPLRNRFWSPLPVTDVGVPCPGFLFAALRNDTTLYYSQLSLNYEYMQGYYNSVYQSHPVKEAIIELEESPGQVTIYCVTSTRFAPTNVSQSVEIPEVGEYVTVIVGVDVADDNIGIKDPGSIERLPDGNQIVITSEPNVRIFNGRHYSAPLCVDAEGRGHVLEGLQALQAAVATGYDEKLGYIIFGSDELPDN